MQSYYRSAFILALPLSTLALHSKGRNVFSTGEGCQENINADTNADNIILTPHNMLDMVHKFPVNELKNCCLATYSQLIDKHTDTDYIRNRSLKNNEFWKIVRQFRIMGSRCYLLYIYNKAP